MVYPARELEADESVARPGKLGSGNTRSRRSDVVGQSKKTSNDP
jgi:hypothetical protein